MEILKWEVVNLYLNAIYFGVVVAQAVFVVAAAAAHSGAGGGGI